jgi:amino-acid N-acetyltransferase
MAGTQSTIIVRRARAEDRARVEELLQSERLPLEGVADHFENYLIAVTAQGVAGAIGLERYGDYALLRSAVVAPEARGRGVGELLTARVLQEATVRGTRHVYLLTTTAADWFERFGFRRIPRNELPAELNASAELSGACPDTAVCMALDLAARTAAPRPRV